MTTSQTTEARTSVGFYLLPPGGGPSSAFSRYGKPDTVLGFGATRLLEVYFSTDAAITGATYSAFSGEAWEPAKFFPIEDMQIAASGTTLEIAAPLSMLAPEGGALDSGDRVQMRLVFGQGVDDAMKDEMLLPISGPALIAVPDLGLTTPVLEVTDPEGDDHGPGSYTYPKDAVFQPGCFDVASFSVGYDENNVVFRIVLRGPLDNAWNSPNGVSVQTVDIYIDQDGPTSGERLLLPGRNAALTVDHAWDYAIWVEGWTPGVYAPGDEAPVQVDAEMVVIADPGQSKITVKVPRAILGDDPQSWAYAAIVMGQEGFPSAGVWRVRDVSAAAEQWRFGGGPADANHARIVDVAWPADATPSQEDMLGTYPPSQQAPADLTADDMAQISMLTAP